MRPIILNATSPHEIDLDRNRKARAWKSFLEGGSNHSARAATLPYIIRRCEREGIAYVLRAEPGYGYCADSDEGSSGTRHSGDAEAAQVAEGVSKNSSGQFF